MASIDFEVEPDGNAGVKIHCAALSAEWKVNKLNSDLTKLAQEIVADSEIKQAGIPGEIDIKDINAIEMYINRLGYTAASLKSPVFQKFIAMPSAVESGVKYVRDKTTFGDMLIEKQVTVHPRYVRRGGTPRVFKVTTDVRGGFLLLYGRGNESSPVQTFKIVAKQLAFTVLLSGAIPNCLVVKSAYRQWAIQFQSFNDMKEAINVINDILKSIKDNLIEVPADSGNAGAAVKVAATVSTTGVGNSNAKVNVEASANVGISGSNTKAEVENTLATLTAGDVTSAFRAPAGGNDLEKLQEENRNLKQEFDQLKSQIENMQERVNELNREKNLQLSSAGDVETKIDREIALEKKRFTDTFRIEIQNLRNHIKELKPLLKAESAVKNVQTDEKDKKEEKKAEDEKEYQMDAKAKQFEDKVGLDVERKILTEMGLDQDKSQIRFKHLHVHRHQFKNIHTHTHVHLDEEAIKEATNVEEKFKTKHIVKHQITQTNTQYLVPKRWFQT